MRKISVGLLVLLALALSVLPARAQVSQYFPDPCKAGFTAMQVAAISVTSATTVQLVAPAAGKGIYVCGLYLDSVGGTSTFEYGTGTTCVGTTALTGALPVAAAATPTQSIFPSLTFLSVPSTATGNGLCIVGGTSTSATAGFIDYVQQ